MPADLDIVTVYPQPQQGLGWIANYMNGQARSVLGLPAAGPITLDGLVSLWQVGTAS